MERCLGGKPGRTHVDQFALYPNRLAEFCPTNKAEPRDRNQQVGPARSGLKPHGATRATERSAALEACRESIGKRFEIGDGRLRHVYADTGHVQPSARQRQRAHRVDERGDYASVQSLHIVGGKSARLAPYPPVERSRRATRAEHPPAVD